MAQPQRSYWLKLTDQPLATGSPRRWRNPSGAIAALLTYPWVGPVTSCGGTLAPTMIPMVAAPRVPATA
jgi:hypothetical protein